MFCYLSNGQSFNHTSDVEIFAQYKNGVPIRTIAQGLVWSDHIKKTVALNRVRSVVYAFLISHSTRPQT